MSRARNATDPIERNMMIPLQCLADGVICRPMHPGVHEAWVKKGAVSLKIPEGWRASRRRAPRILAGLTQCELTPPMLHGLSADLPAQEVGVGRVVSQGAGSDAPYALENSKPRVFL